MIDPKELRWGNYILLRSKDCKRPWTGEPMPDGDDFLLQVSKNFDWQLHGDKFTPIPLTDAVLEACGFEKDYPIYKVPHESLSHIEKNGYKQTKDYGKWLWFNRCGDMEISVGASFQYLHQLQNLYFALTGVDLEIDETKLKQALC